MPEKIKTVEELNRELLEVQLETARVGLEEAKRKNADYKVAEARRHEHNRQRQAEIEQGQKTRAMIVKRCRHKSGGSPTNIARGGGKFSFSLITRAIMPDGVTEFLQCSRCPLKLYGRERGAAEEKTMEKAAKKAAEERLEHNPKSKFLSPAEQAWTDHQLWKELREVSIEEGLEHGITRGPTFMFQNENGIPIIPELR